MKLAKDMMLMALGATAAILVEKYGCNMLDMASDMMKDKKCRCTELDD